MSDPTHENEAEAPLEAAERAPEAPEAEAAPGEDEALQGGESRAGFVALIGRPNVGKSTLLNRLLGEKVAIATSRPQTTRNRILGLYNAPDLQIALLDTPGIHKARTGLNRYMVEVALSAIAEVDAVLLLLDAERLVRGISPRSPRVRPDPADLEIVSRIREAGRPALLAINKVDAVRRDLLLPIIDAYREVHPWVEVVPISARTGDGVELLPKLLAASLPVSPPLFPPDLLTDQLERFLAAESIREQVILATREEVPYAAAVEILQFDESERGEDGEGGLVRIEANVVVERDSQKGIVIGKGGQMLKRIGTAARKDLERMLGAKVWLGLHVRVEKDWTRSPKGLRKLGYE